MERETGLEPATSSLEGKTPPHGRCVYSKRPSTPAWRTFCGLYSFLSTLLLLGLTAHTILCVTRRGHSCRGRALALESLRVRLLTQPLPRQDGSFLLEHPDLAAQLGDLRPSRRDQAVPEDPSTSARINHSRPRSRSSRGRGSSARCSSLTNAPGDRLSLEPSVNGVIPRILVVRLTGAGPQMRRSRQRATPVWST